MDEETEGVETLNFIKDDAGAFCNTVTSIPVMKDVIREVYFPTKCFLGQPTLLPPIYVVEHLLFDDFIFFALHNLDFKQSYKTLCPQTRCT